jgi:hypothetical protein
LARELFAIQAAEYTPMQAKIDEIEASNWLWVFPGWLNLSASRLGPGFGVVQNRVTVETRNPFVGAALSIFGVTRNQHFLNHAHIQRLLTARAKDLLRHTRMSILEVAQAVGFQSPSHFAEVFLRDVTVSPDDWRRRMAAA